MLFKRLLAALVLFTGLALGQTQTPASDSSAQLPFFFPAGFKQTIDPLEQRTEYVRWLNSTWHCNQGDPNGMGGTIPGVDSIRVQTDVVSTDSVTENPAKMLMVFDHYVRMPDGRVRYSDLCHTEIITDAQFQTVVNGLKQQAVVAAHRDNEFYSKIQRRAVEVRAAKVGLKNEEFIKELPEQVPDTKITYAELNQIMKPSRDSDFIPRELHLGFNPPLGGILGVTWLNTGVIYYNPDAWITDALNGVPKVMQHEMVHGNINIEKWPMSEAFDVELMASLPEMLYLENTTDFPSHGYAKDIRELAQIYYGLDWAEMHKQVVKFDYAGNTEFDPVAYKHYYAEIERVKAEMMKFFMDVTIPEFYSDPVWWSAINDVRGDNNTVFRITMAQHYQICSLGGCAASQQWLEEHKDEIIEIAKRALDAGLGKDRSNGKFNDVSPWMIDQYNKMFTPAEQANIEAYFKLHPDQLKNLQKMSPVEAVQFMQRFKFSTMQGVAIR